MGKADYGKRPTPWPLSGPIARNFGYKSNHYNRGNGGLHMRPKPYPGPRYQARQMQGQKDSFVYRQNEFPPLPSQDDKIDELVSSAVNKFQSCLENMLRNNKESILQHVPAPQQHVSVPQYGQAIFGQQVGNAKN